jgi:hypothetical protein
MTIVRERGPASKVHEIRCWPPHFEEIASGRKLVDIRPADREYRVGDVLIQREFDPARRLTDPDTQVTVLGDYTGKVCICTVTHVLTGGQFGLQNGYVALSLGPVDALSGLTFTHVHEHWFIFWGGPDPNHCAGTMERDDEEDCWEFIAIIGGASECGVARQLRCVLPMEVVTRDA